MVLVRSGVQVFRCQVGFFASSLALAAAGGFAPDEISLYLFYLADAQRYRECAEGCGGCQGTRQQGWVRGEVRQHTRTSTLNTTTWTHYTRRDTHTARQPCGLSREGCDGFNWRTLVVRCYFSLLRVLFPS